MIMDLFLACCASSLEPLPDARGTEVLVGMAVTEALVEPLSRVIILVE